MSPNDARYVAYFPGCMSLDCARELDASLRAVFEALDVEAVEISDWNCCGGDYIDSVLPKAADALTGRILERARAAELICACPVCVSRLRKPDAKVRVHSALELLAEPHMQALISERRQEDLKGLKAACYYGPARGIADDAPDASMEDLVRTCGLSPVKWAGKRRPHGGTSAFIRPALMRALAGKVLTDAIDAGADFIIVEDPHAQFNLDVFQYPIGRDLARAVDIPVLFVSELVAHTLGLEMVERCYSRHATPPFGILMDHYDRQSAVISKDAGDDKSV